MTAHGHSQKHKDNIAIAKSQGAFETMELQGQFIHERVANFEICTSLYTYNHINLAIKTVNDFVPFVKKLAEDPEAVKGMKLKEDKCSNIIRHVLLNREF